MTWIDEVAKLSRNFQASALSPQDKTNYADKMYHAVPKLLSVVRAAAALRAVDQLTEELTPYQQTQTRKDIWTELEAALRGETEGGDGGQGG